jgi:hypothetical protein
MTSTRRWPVKTGRNNPCRCGSGIKAKRCCDAAPELRTTTARAVLARLQPEVIGALAGLERKRFRQLYDEMIYLPELDISLHLRLPGLLSLEIEEAMYACRVHDDEGFDEALRHAARMLDTFERRLELAEAVLALRDRGLVHAALAAVAIVDLNQAESALLVSSLAQTVAVASGDEKTPSGLLIAAR